MDVAIKDGKHVPFEVKSRVSKSDIAELRRIGMLYKKVRSVEPDLIIVRGFIDPEAYKAGVRLNVEKPAMKEA